MTYLQVLVKPPNDFWNITTSCQLIYKQMRFGSASWKLFFNIFRYLGLYLFIIGTIIPITCGNININSSNHVSWLCEFSFKLRNIDSSLNISFKAFIYLRKEWSILKKFMYFYFLIIMFLNFVFTEGRWNEKLFKSNISSKSGILKIIHFHTIILFEPNDTFKSKSNPAVMYIPH